VIARIWHGWTTLENEMTYQTILLSEVIPGIRAKNLPGFIKMEVMKRQIDCEIEFTTVMWFNSLENIKSFAGDDYETAYVPERARAVLKRFDNKAIHRELVEEISIS
jgi:antibiotic biosynthesis monooxygenase (ABM) superfamily enzyme